MIPLISFAEEPIYFDCNFTCQRNTTYFESGDSRDQILDGCQDTRKRGERTVIQKTYKFYKNKMEVHDWRGIYQCEIGSDASIMNCTRYKGVKYNDPVMRPEKGKMIPMKTYMQNNYFSISRTTLDASSEFKWQANEDSRIIYSDWSGKCEMNKVKF